MWIDYEPAGTAKVNASTMIVAVSTSMPQYKALYSQARELGEYMLKKMEFKKVGTFRSSAYPPEVLVRDDGTATLPECSFYLGGKGDLLLFAGDTSPMEEQYDFAKALLEKAKTFGVKELYSIGARWAENPQSPEVDPEPSGFATDKAGVAKLKKNGVKVLSEEPAPFFASMVVAMARGYGMRGYKLSVDHGEPSPHVRSVTRILELLTKLAGFEVDMDELRAQAKPSSLQKQAQNTQIYQ